MLLENNYYFKFMNLAVLAARLWRALSGCLQVQNAIISPVYCCLLTKYPQFRLATLHDFQLLTEFPSHKNSFNQFLTL